MSEMNPELRRALRITGFAAVTGTLLPAFALREAMTPKGSREALRDRWLARWSDALLKLFAVTVVAGDGRPAPARTRGRGRLIVANHRSTIDIAIALRTFGGFMVSRGDLANWPLVGAAARRVGTVFVDRSDSVSGAAAIRHIRDLLKGGHTVTIFPEGTTFPGDEVRPFHPGAFVAALHTQCEVIPVGIAYETGSGAAFVDESFMQHLNRMASAPPTRVAVTIGEPIVVREGVRGAELRERSHAAVVALVKSARAAVDRDLVAPPAESTTTPST